VAQLLAMGHAPQAAMTQQVVERAEEHALSSRLKGDPERIRNWESAKHPMASAAFHALPQGTNVLTNQQFQLASLIRLGEVSSDKWPTNDAAPNLCQCGQVNKVNIRHLLTCQRTGVATYRHNHVRDTLAAVLADCHKTAIVEPGLTTVPGGREGHRADIATFNVVGDGRLVELLDVCITSGYTEECKSSTVAGEAARRAHQGKLTTYKSIIDAKGALVLPVVFDTTGCPAPQGTVEKLVAALAPRYTPPEEAVSWAAPTAKVALTQRLSVAVMRAVVNAVIRLRSNGAAPGPHPRSG
jgi:hypothetical protein